MTSKKTGQADLPIEDALTLLIADHRRVKRLFAAFNALKDEGSDVEKSKLVADICLELTIHTAIEEEIFYPAVRKAIDDDDSMDEALVEHAGAKTLIAQLRAANPDDELYNARVTVLSEQIDHHVTEEEGSMFPKARHTELDLHELAVQMQRRKAELLAREPLPPQRVSSAPANPAASPPTGNLPVRKGASLRARKAPIRKTSRAVKTPVKRPKTTATSRQKP
jgi:hemerythrin superfamily protein